MKYLDEYRDGDIAAKLVERIRRVQTRPWRSWKSAVGRRIRS